VQPQDHFQLLRDRPIAHAVLATLFAFVEPIHIP
jgi:hypothetical protein